MHEQVTFVTDLRAPGPSYSQSDTHIARDGSSEGNQEITRVSSSMLLAHLVSWYLFIHFEI